MALRNHMEPYLPRWVELLEEDTIGTRSGNPTSAVVYGLHHKPPKGGGFVVAEVVPNASSCDIERSVRAFGTLPEPSYYSAMQMFHDDRDTGWQNMINTFGPLGENVEVSISVPRMRTTEFILGHALEIIFDQAAR